MKLDKFLKWVVVLSSIAVVISFVNFIQRHDENSATTSQVSNSQGNTYKSMVQ